MFRSKIYCFAATLMLSSALLNAQTQSVLEANKKATNGKTFLIRYKLDAGEILVSKVQHFAETSTRMSDHDENSHSRTISEKVWTIESVNDAGDMVFEYRINSVNLAQTVGEGKELTYNSKTDTEVPDMFKQVAETVNQPLATVTINSRGQVKDRDDESRKNAPKLGMGELTIPLPEEAVAIGGQWSVPREVRVKQENGVHKKVKVRELYTLEKVSAGVATISIVTQPLTPVRDPGVEAQLIQQLSAGKIKFDLDNGRMLSKELNWSDEVVGFRGPETSLRYSAEFTEKLIEQTQRTASRSTSDTK